MSLHVPSYDDVNCAGGPAFPFQGEHTGMTLRDWFAGQALNALIGGNSASISKVADKAQNSSVATAAAAAYELADAMLEARK